MDYNTSRNHLNLPEYGRNIQKMVNHVKTVEDREERNRLAQAIIDIMGNMNPHLRDVADFKHKLWDHIAIISDFDLDVESPYEPPVKEDLYVKPEKMNYMSSKDIRYKHYGRVLEGMIKEAVSFEEGDEKNFLIEVIANQMKKSYLTWNRETVADDLIFHDLVKLSKDQLTIPEGLRLRETRELLASKPSTTGRKQHSRHQSNPRGKKQYKKR